MKAYVGAKILSRGVWLDDQAVVVDAGRITAVSAKAPKSAERVDLAGGMLVPGFIDTQVNGGGGVLLNDHPTVEGVRAIAEAHRQFGTTGLFPTLISDDLSQVARAIAAVDAAIAANAPGILGIHLEGPFLNPKKKGIHDASKFRRIDADALELLSSLKNGKTLVTLAPELADAGVIKELVKRGVVVAAGHTLASYDAMQSAFAEGLSGVTHLFNAMTPLESRAPGVVGAALENRACVCGIIVDGHHVDPAALRVALAAHGAEGMMLVTDAMPSVGSDITSFMLGATTIVVKDGTLRGPDGTLAGSHLDMATAVRNSVTMLGVPLSIASHMASAVPARFMGLAQTHGDIAPGMHADLVHLSDALEVLSVY